MANWHKIYVPRKAKVVRQGKVRILQGIGKGFASKWQFILPKYVKSFAGFKKFLRARVGK